MSAQLEQAVNQEIQKEISSGKFEGSCETAVFDGNPHFEACIETKGFRNIKIKYNPDYEEKNPGKTTLVARDITRHEINHKGYRGFNGCPQTLDNHAELIIEPIAEVLAPKGFGNADIHYVGNALEDTLLHVDLNSRFALAGIAAFLQDVGESSEERAFSPFYEAHTRLNMALWGHKPQKKELSRYFTRDAKQRKKIINAVQGFLSESGISELKAEVSSGSNAIEARDKSQVRECINNPENWPKIASAYAKHFSTLMTPNYAMPLPNHSGEGTKGRESEEPQKSEPEKSGNEFDKEMESEQFKSRRIQKAYSEGSGIPSWMDGFEALDLLYQSLAKKLNIKAQSYTQEMKKPVFFHGTREFNPDKDNLRQIKFGFNDESGKIELKKRRYHEDMTVPYKKQPKGFPEARFCLLDTSGSMQSDSNNGQNIGNNKIIPWGDRSKYHFALLGWYGFLEYLKQNHLLSQMSVGLGNFSDRTLIAGGLEDAKRLALTPQFGNTYLDKDAISGLFEGSGKLIFTVSDGEIANWDDVHDYFISRAKEHQYFHLQIGSANSTTKQMKKAGLKIEYIKSAEDLAGKVIDLTDNLYRGGEK